MKKHLVALIFLMIISVSLLSAMEIERQELLTDHIVIDIREQQQGWYGAVKQQEVQSDAIASSSLRDMHKTLCGMSDKDKCKAIKKMKTQALMLSCAAVYLPAEIVRDHICFFLFNGYKQAVEQFYTDPSAQALEVYNEINSFVKYDLRPIGPLYVAPREERDVILGLKKSVFINAEQKKLFDAIPHELKALYIQGTEVSIKNDLCNSELVKNSFISGLSVTAIILLFLVPVALIFTGTPASDPRWDQLLNWAGPVFGVSGGLGLLVGGTYYVTSSCCRSRQVIL